MKLPGRNTAERYAFQTMLRRQLQTGALTPRQQLTLLLRQGTGYNRSHRMQNIAAGKIIGYCYLGPPCHRYKPSDTGYPPLEAPVLNSFSVHSGSLYPH